ncbi:hypothetical protein [Mycobacteroides abscessus]|uniref:hypothetical protein n=1 Tax=Mycobacteroides abscessus TaxID=36809 RepID=UPI000D848E55|nr:hypothetical protein [Mycobacteroides abscessus]SPX87715.1 Uncharacterised protein [Mycobacteroides abscessus]
MNADLEAIKSAMDKDREGGRDQELARTLADSYVAANPDEFTDLTDKTLSACVEAVDVFRNAGYDEMQWRVETWLLHNFEPQHIGGETQAQVRI